MYVVIVVLRECVCVCQRTSIECILHIHARSHIIYYIHFDIVLHAAMCSCEYVYCTN